MIMLLLLTALSASSCYRIAPGSDAQTPHEVSTYNTDVFVERRGDIAIGRTETGNSFIANKLIAFVHRDITFEEVAQAITIIDGEIMSFTTLRRYHIRVPISTEEGLRNMGELLLNTYPHIFELVSIDWLTGLNISNQPHDEYAPGPDENVIYVTEYDSEVFAISFWEAFMMRYREGWIHLLLLVLLALIIVPVVIHRKRKKRK